MARTRSVALVCSGQVSRSFLSRLPGLAEHLGPVKAPSYRLASRTVNSIRAGHPVGAYKELEGCRLILVAAPAGGVPRMAEELAATPLRWAAKAVIVCDERLDSGVLGALAGRGAHTGSLGPVEGFAEQRFVVEGDHLAVRYIRKLIEAGGGRVLELRQSAKPLYLAGMAFASSLVTPLLAASSECLRGAGLSSFQTSAVIERALARSLRGYLKGGKKSWSAPPLGGAGAELEGLDPLLADYFLMSARLAARMLGGAAPAEAL